MAAGYHVSLDPPGTVSVALCLVQAILPKDVWLAVSVWELREVGRALRAENRRYIDEAVIFAALERKRAHRRERRRPDAAEAA